jgi:hypothetical protein
MVQEHVRLFTISPRVIVYVYINMCNCVLSQLIYDGLVCRTGITCINSGNSCNGWLNVICLSFEACL